MSAGWDRATQAAFAAGLWRGDPTLWSTDAAHQQVAARRLGWLALPATMRGELAALGAFAVFGERLAELRDPVAEMRSAGTLFDARAKDLADLPVLLQTGKEDGAMKTVLYFIEVFNKVIRLIPELRQAGVDLDAFQIEGQGLAEFYGAFNGVLRDLTDAFEHKDAVLIGDLAEYEILPRMRSFFAAMDGALPA